MKLDLSNKNLKNSKLDCPVDEVNALIIGLTRMVEAKRAEGIELQSANQQIFEKLNSNEYN